MNKYDSSCSELIIYYNALHIKKLYSDFMSFPVSPRKKLQGFNVIISTEHVGNMNYYMSSKAVTTDWRITTSLG